MRENMPKDYVLVDYNALKLEMSEYALRPDADVNEAVNHMIKWIDENQMTDNMFVHVVMTDSYGNEKVVSSTSLDTCLPRE